MKERSDATTAQGAAPEPRGVVVSIFVPDDHPLLRLKRALDWEAIEAVMVKYWHQAGKNVQGGPGRLWPVALYVPLLVLMWLKSYHARQMEEYLNESVVARCFVELRAEQGLHIRDHASIARAEAALGVEGKAAVNSLIIHTAKELGFTDGKILSADTTVQEPLIGYPNEPGILKGAAERIERALRKLKERGVKGVQAGIAKAKEIYHSVKQHHLFAKTTAERKRVLKQIVEQSEELIALTQAVIEQVSERCGRVKQSAATKLTHVVAVCQQLLPQIKQWLKTGQVATAKILHVGLSEARAIVKGKGQGKVKFGMKWLINRLKGGYLFGQRVEPHASETQMPQESLKAYREVLGQEATPQMVVYDRGASLPSAASKLQAEGVQKVGIPPRGQGAWLVGEKEQKVVKSERGKTEGSLGRLKSTKYGFSHRQERSLETQDAAGQRAIVSVNLNTLLQDLIEQATAANLVRC